MLLLYSRIFHGIQFRLSDFFFWFKICFNGEITQWSQGQQIFPVIMIFSIVFHLIIWPKNNVSLCIVVNTILLSLVCTDEMLVTLAVLGICIIWLTNHIYVAYMLFLINYTQTIFEENLKWEILEFCVLFGENILFYDEYRHDINFKMVSLKKAEGDTETYLFNTVALKILITQVIYLIQDRNLGRHLASPTYWHDNVHKFTVTLYAAFIKLW